VSGLLGGRSRGNGGRGGGGVMDEWVRGGVGRRRRRKTTELEERGGGVAVISEGGVGGRMESRGAVGREKKKGCEGPTFLVGEGRGGSV